MVRQSPGAVKGFVGGYSLLGPPRCQDAAMPVMRWTWLGVAGVIPLTDRSVDLSHGTRRWTGKAGRRLIRRCDSQVATPRNRSELIRCYGHGPQLASRARRADAPTVPLLSRSCGPPESVPHTPQSASRSSITTVPDSSTDSAVPTRKRKPGPRVSWLPRWFKPWRRGTPAYGRSLTGGTAGRSPSPRIRRQR